MTIEEASSFAISRGGEAHSHSFLPALRNTLVRLLLLAATMLYCTTASAHDRNTLRLYSNPETATTETEYVANTLVQQDPHRQLMKLVDDLNKTIHLDRGIHIVFASQWMIGEWASNVAPDELAFFDRNETDNIFISYELIEKFAEVLEYDVDIWFPNVIHVVLHEIGHGLVHVNNIAIEEGEYDEQVADEIAFFVMSEFYQADDALREVIRQFDASAWDAVGSAGSDHLFERAVIRSANYGCWIDGKLGLDPECVGEYEKLRRRWYERLNPFFKNF